VTARAPEMKVAQADGRGRLIVGIGLGGLILGCIVAARLGWVGVAHGVDALTDTSRNAGPLGWVLFALAQTAVAMIGVVPASLLGIAAGAVYGLWLGFALSTIGTMCGGWLAFMLARSLLRPWITRRLATRVSGRAAELDAAIMRDGWRLVCLLRISPVMPFALTSYALGLTHISIRDYLVGTLAALPALLGYVTAGIVAGHGVQMATGVASVGEPIQWLLICAGVIATCFLILRSGALLASCGLLPEGPDWVPFQSRK
jgi:uncharacterized membrane protein YdjX (TVP38/TMEM64 family)